MSDFSEHENELLDGESADLVYSFAQVGPDGLILAARSSGLYRSTDGGQTWEDALAELNLSEPLPVTSLAASPLTDHQASLFAGAPGGVFRSMDGGQTWRTVVFPPPAPTVSALVVSPNFAADATLFAGTMEDGVFVSTSGGDRFVTWNFGLLDLNVMCLAISPNFAADETIFAGTETGIFRSTNGGRAWREVELPFGFDAIISLAFSPRYSEDHTLYAGTESQGLWVSSDEGETWARLAEGMLDDPVNAVLVSEDGLLVVTSAALLHSSDGGLTWTDRLPEGSEEREISAALLPRGFGPGAPALLGLTDGSIEAITLKE